MAAVVLYRAREEEARLSQPKARWERERNRSYSVVGAVFVVVGI